MKRLRKEKWRVLSSDDDVDYVDFTNLKAARAYAKEISLEYSDCEFSICLIDECIYYFNYLNGKCVRNGWDIKKRKAKQYIK